MKRLAATTLLVAGIGINASSALGCASCGSGGDDPMILYPNERNKLYFGLSRSSNFQNVDSDGALSTAGGPEVKEAATLSYGHGFTPRSFATITLPFMRNVLGDSAETSPGDPSLAGRYTLVMQSMAEPLVPQVQVVAGYKYAQATSIHDSKELKTQIDVFGTGFSEAKAGVDVWYGQSDVKLGAAHTIIAPQERSFDGVSYQPGIGHRSTLSVGYSVGILKGTIGANRERRGALRVDGVEQGSSKLVNNSAFVTAELMATSMDIVRMTVARQAAFGKNQNTARSNALSIAYMRSI